MPGAVEGVQFTTVTIDVPVYLNYLLARFLGRGGRVVRAAIQHISQAIEGAFAPSAGPHANRSPAAVIVCAGLGARTLGGVEDKDVYPIRGQTVLVRAPWVRFGRTMSGNGEDSVWTYIIPRRSGDVSVTISIHLALGKRDFRLPLGLFLVSSVIRGMGTYSSSSARTTSKVRTFYGHRRRS